MNAKTAHVENQGQIKTMNLPSDWVEAPDRKRDDFDLRSLRKFHHPSNSDVQLCLYHRGTPITDDSADNFSRVLAAKPHQLTPSELLGVQQILGDMFLQDAFQILSARTDDLNGRRVLEVKGRWKELNMDQLSIFLPAEGAASLIQEVYFVAPVDEYARHLQQATAAIKSIEWVK